MTKDCLQQEVVSLTEPIRSGVKHRGVRTAVVGSCGVNRLSSGWQALAVRQHSTSASSSNSAKRCRTKFLCLSAAFEPLQSAINIAT